MASQHAKQRPKPTRWLCLALRLPAAPDSRPHTGTILPTMWDTSQSLPLSPTQNPRKHTHTRHMPPLGQNVLWLRATALNRHPTEARTVSPGTWSCPYAQVSRSVSKGIRDGVESLMAQLQPDLASAPGVGDTQTARGCSCEAPMQLPPWFLCPSSPGDLYRLVAPHSESQINQHGPTEVCMAPDPSQVQTTC